MAKYLKRSIIEHLRKSIRVANYLEEKISSKSLTDYKNASKRLLKTVTGQYK